MDGKYVGNRPIKLSKIKDDLYGKIDTVSVSGRKVCPFPSLSLFPPLAQFLPLTYIPSSLSTLYSSLPGTRKRGIQREMES